MIKMTTLMGSPWTRRRVARAAGGLYLAFIMASVLASIVGNIGLSDAQSLYQTVTSSPWAFRLGLTSALMSALLFLLAAWALYVLLSPVNRSLALLFLLLNLVGVGVQCASLLFLISAAQLSSEASYLAAFSSAQLTGLTYASIGLYKTGFAMAQLFFGAWLFPLGYLVYKSTFLPKALGWLLILDGCADLFWLFQTLLLPAYPMISYPAWVIGFVAEFGLTLWLLVKGATMADAAVAQPSSSQLPR
jgi:hypothetical protein